MANKLADDILKLLESDSFADVQIICKTHIFKAHKAILCSRSPYFLAAFSGGWQESSSGQLRVDHMEPNILEIMFKYIYCGKIIFQSTPDDGHFAFVTFIQLFIYGDYFQLDQLKNDAVYEIRISLYEVLLNMWTFQKPSSCHTEPEYFDQVFKHFTREEFATELAKAIEVAYGHPAARSIQKLLLVVCAGLRDQMPQRIFSILMEKVPGFKADAVALLVGLHFWAPDDQGPGRGTVAQQFAPLLDLHFWADDPGAFDYRLEVEQSGGGMFGNAPASRPRPGQYAKGRCCSLCRSDWAICDEPEVVMVDPFVGRSDLWCYSCRAKALAQRVEGLVKQLPD